MTAALAALALLAAAAEPRAYTIEPSASAVRYFVNHKLHKVDAVSRGAEGKALVDAEGMVRTMVRIPVQSFESGDSNRDSHMLETLEAGKHPFVVFKGVGQVTLPAPGARPAPLTLRGELDFHGVKRPVEVPVTVEVAKDGGARVRGKLTVSLEAHQIERPSLLMIKLDDACVVELDLKLGRSE
jgi:polyisoprenoid-binding protein YceI